MSISVSQLCSHLSAEMHQCSGQHAEQLEFNDVAALSAATPNDLSYLDSEKNLFALKETQAAAVIIPMRLVERAGSIFAGPLLAVENPQVAFIEAMLLFRPSRDRATVGVSALASVSPEAVIGRQTNIHPGVSIGPDVVIGANCEVHPGVVIGAGCRIGDDTTIYPNAVLYQGMQIGNRVIIHANAVIGADGFGYRFENNSYVKIPHTGNVVIEDDVEIGAGTTIDRAMIGQTVIGEGTKLDNQIMIAHNCRLGKHNAYASQVGFAGSTTTGDYVRCGGQAGVADHLHLGTGSTVGPKAGVHADIPDGETHHGMPALRDKEQIRIALSVRKLPDLLKKIRLLEQQLAALQTEIENSQQDEESQRAA